MLTDEYGVDTYPWERQREETPKSFEAFVMYRDLGYKRTLRKVILALYGIDERVYERNGEHAGKARTVERWSSKYHWTARVEEYDRWLDKQTQADHLEAVRAMRVRHAQISSIAAAKMATYLNGLDDVKLSRMTPDQAMRMFDIAAKNERIARGVPDRIVAVTDKDGNSVKQDIEVTSQSLERKFEAFLSSRDPGNTIESGEPPERLAEIAQAIAEDVASHPWPADDAEDPYAGPTTDFDPNEEQ